MGIQIHELDNFIGTLGDDTYLAIDDGVETNKIPATAIRPPAMTLEEATAGLETEDRTIAPKVLYDFTGIDATTITLYESLGWTQEASA